ncbi:putative Phosphoserine phosphatase [Candidatus Nitrospira nitrificans]|uniref:Anti-sigma factor antagonist n=2 Tax=Candidatus Nitrospira nitrificans TaxID=1742973 RepID=A0A0S4LSN1_9BACT|nr:putative Phosphoserine phosphatase [Candidatus Nitrospira nitrificans]
MLGMCDPLLGISSMLLGGAAAYVILSIAERMRAPDQGSVRFRWLTIGAVAAGLEIWAIHYIGNLAFCPQVSAAQDSALAVLSLVSAGATGAVAVYLISSHINSRMRLVSGGMLMGACMSLTHFASMMAVHQPIDLENDLMVVVLSTVGIVALSVIGIVIGAWNITTYRNWRVTEKASAMGIALSGSHFIGMIPTYGLSAIRPGAPPPGIEVDLLAVVAVSLSTLLAIIDRQVTAASSLARDSHARLIEAIESVPQWFALFDAEDRLVICNRKYREVMSGVGAEVQPGDTFESIIRRIAERGDIDAALVNVESWVKQRLEMHHNPQGPYIQYRSNGEWLQISEKRTHDGGIVAIATDITALKNAEQAAEDANARLADSLAVVEAAKARMQEELNVGRDIQRSMLPRVFPAFPDRKEIELYAVLEPALEIGGDLYDFFMVDDHRLCFVIGDVAGNGVPAALFMAMTKIMVKTRATSDPSPASIVTHVNDALSADNDSCMFVTLYLGILNLRDGTLLATNAGHNPPLLKRQDGQFEWLTGIDGPMVGPMAGIAFKETTIQLGPGDELFLYTDGVTEADNRRRELFGNDRLKRVLTQSRAVSVVDRLGEVMNAVRSFAVDAPQADDITMLGLRYHGVAPSGVATRVFRRTMPNQLAVIPDLQMAFEQYVAQWDAAKPLIPTFNMALDDLLNNVVQYAFPNDPTEHHIEVEGEVRDTWVIFTITDDGIPFNPLTVAPPDLSLLLHEREIGGLGIHLVRSMFDEVSYHRNVGRNVLTVKKKLASGPSSAMKPPDKTGIRAFEVERLPSPLRERPRNGEKSVDSRRSGTVMIVTPQTRFDTNSAPEVERILLDHIGQGERQIVLDLSRISYISSIGLRVILKVLMAMTRTDGNIVLCGGNDHVRTVLRLSGALMMSLYASTLEEALSKVHAAR